jgi:hypothetical protein
MQNTYSMVVYNRQLFEKFSMIEKETGSVNHCYIIDGKEVSEEDWTRQQQSAMAREVIFARRNKSQPLPVPVKP